MLKIFTDVLDPFLWGIFPLLRKLEFKYKNFNYEFRMGGLIGNYEEFLPKNFREKNSVELGNRILYDMYRATSTITSMPGFKSPPNLFSEKYKSSYPLDKYFVTFKELDNEDANEYMRKMIETMIIYHKNIYEMEVQKEILKNFDVNIDDFIMSSEFSDELFLQERMEAFDYRIKKLPGFLITENNRVLQNIMDFNRIEEFILENLELEDRESNLSKEEEILDFIKSYDLVLKEEIDIVFGKENKLNELLNKDVVKIDEVNGFNILKIASDNNE